MIVYKKVAKAFFRNKIKRWVREIFRTSKSDFLKDIDILFVVRGGTCIVSLNLLQDAFLTALQEFQEASQ